MNSKTKESLERFHNLRLIAISDATRYGDPCVGLAPLIRQVPPGRLAVLLREKKSTAQQRRAWATSLQPLLREHQQLLFISDDLELVLELEADGLHCSRSFHDLRTARNSLGSRWLSQGCSLGVNQKLSLQEMQANDLLTARLLSPVFESRKGRAALTPTGFAQFQSRLSLEITEDASLSPLLVALGGARADLIASSARLAPKCTWRAAAIESVHDPREQRRWIDLLTKT